MWVNCCLYLNFKSFPISLVEQRSPTFLAPGIGFVEDNFSTIRGGGMVWG